jgi:CHAD domain-containing protein
MAGKLLKRSRKLQVMSAKKRHRLRLRNKKLCYSIEFLSDLYSVKRSPAQLTAMAHLRKARKSLGQLNDDATVRLWRSPWNETACVRPCRTLVADEKGA